MSDSLIDYAGGISQRHEPEPSDSGDTNPDQKGDTGLIEKLEALGGVYKDTPYNYAVQDMGVNGIQSAESPDRVKTDAQDQFNSDAPAKTSEISVVSDEKMLVGIIDDAWYGASAGRLGAATAVLQALRPYFRATEPGEGKGETADEIYAKVVKGCKILGIPVPTPEPDKYPDCGSEMIQICSGLEDTCKQLHKPVSVSLEKCVEAHADVMGRKPNEEPYESSYRATKAVLDAAGVKYED